MVCHQPYHVSQTDNNIHNLINPFHSILTTPRYPTSGSSIILGDCDTTMANQDFPVTTHTPPNYSDDGDITSPSSDPHDSTYSEPPRVNNPWITTKQRKGLLEDFSEAAKKRVQKATAELAMLRCVVFNTPELYSVNYAHILARATDPRIVSNEKFLYYIHHFKVKTYLFIQYLDTRCYSYL